MIALIGMNANAAIYIVGQAPFGDWQPDAGVEMVSSTAPNLPEVTMAPTSSRVKALSTPSPLTRRT